MLEMQRRMSRGFLVLLALPATAMGFALCVQISALSWILATRYGLHIDEIGLVWAAGPLAGIIGQLLIGVVSDGVWIWGGRRRAFIVGGGVITALMILALPWMGAIAHALGGVPLLGVAIAVALGLDLAINIGFNPTRSIITDVTREGAQRTRGYTWMQTVSGTFGVLAYAIGAVFDNYVLIYCAVGLVLVFSVIPGVLVAEPRELPGAAPAGAAPAHGPGPGRLLVILLPLWGYLAYDVAGMALKVAGLGLTTLEPEIAFGVATAVVVAITLAARDRGPQHAKEDLVEFRKVLAAHAFTWVGVQAMFVYMFSVVQYRFPQLDTGAAGGLLARAFLVLSAVAAILPSTVLEPLALRLGQVRVHAGCLFIMALGYAGLYFLGTTPLAITLLMAVLGVGWASIVSLPFAIMSQRVESSRIGLFMGVFNLSIVLPQLFVSLGLGPILDRTQDKALMFLLCAAALLVSAIAWLFVRHGDPATPSAAPGAAAH